MADSNNKKEFNIAHQWKCQLQFAIGVTAVIGIEAVTYALMNIITVFSNIMMVTRSMILISIVLLCLGVFLPMSTFFAYRAMMQGNSKIMIKICRAIEIAILTAMLVSIASSITTAIIGGSQYSLDEAITNYHDDPVSAANINRIQKSFGCCGVYGISDWNKNKRFSCQISNQNPERCDIPPSCCVSTQDYMESLSCGHNALNASTYQQRSRVELFHVEGCSSIVNELVYNSSKYTSIWLNLIFVLEAFIWKFMRDMMLLQDEHLRRKRIFPRSIKEI